MESTVLRITTQIACNRFMFHYFMSRHFHTFKIYYNRFMLLKEIKATGGKENSTYSQLKKTSTELELVLNVVLDNER